jgi:hypothetical protein
VDGGSGLGGQKRPAAFPGLEATIRQQLPPPQLNKPPSIDFVEEGGSDGNGEVVIASHGRSPPPRIRDDYYSGGGGPLVDYEDDIYDMPTEKGGYGHELNGTLNFFL